MKIGELGLGKPWGPGLCIFALTGVISCSGSAGGDGPANAVAGSSFAFSMSGDSCAEGDDLAIDVELTAPASGLAQDITLDVVDLGSGTATSGSDFTVFADQTLTFLAGSVSGDTQTVTLNSIVDSVIEGADETIVLGLENESGESLGSQTSFVVTLLEDDKANLQFSFGTSATASEATALHAVTVQLDIPAGKTLGASASALVSDAGSGSASLGADYAAFGAQVVSFGPGSTDGMVQTVNLSVLDDAEVELDETVALSLGDVSAGTTANGIQAHMVTIMDDDVSGLASLHASAGPTGTESVVDHEDVLDLGNQTVGAGPNAGTQLRLTNLGSSSMSLGAPVLVGSHANDFAIEIELAPMLVGGSSTGLGTSEHEALAAHDMATPLVARLDANAGPGVALEFNLATLTEMEGHSRARLHGFPIPGLGQVTLDLEQLNLPIAPGAQLVVDGVPVAGGLEGAVAGLTIWKGEALELPGSRALISFSPAGPQGFLELPGDSGRVVHIFTEEETTLAGELVCRVVHEDDLLAMGLSRPSNVCSDSREVPGAAQLSLEATGSMPMLSDLTAANCQLAIETDYQLYQRFGSVQGTTDYVTQLIAAVSEQYFRDVQTTLTIAYLGVYSIPGDPWSAQDSGGDAGDVLDEFKAAWAGGWPATANLAHFISGASLGGGVAYVNVLCNQSYGFGVSGNINGNVNWGSWSGTAGSFTWDYVVVAHELGHQFGTGHTHSYCPPLDHCSTNCESTTSCSQSTIMSYCHTCGGMDNIDLNFNPVVANLIRSRVQSSCLGDSTLAAGDYVQYLVRFNPQGTTGARSASVEFTHNAGNQPNPFRVQLQGTAD